MGCNNFIIWFVHIIIYVSILVVASLPSQQLHILPMQGLVGSPVWNVIPDSLLLIPNCRTYGYNRV